MEWEGESGGGGAEAEGEGVGLERGGAEVDEVASLGFFVLCLFATFRFRFLSLGFFDFASSHHNAISYIAKNIIFLILN